MQKETILIVDDDTELLSAIDQMLSDCDYAVTLATDGKDALMKIKNQSCNLVLADIVMKGMNGLDLLDEIKRISPKTVVVLMTGYGTEKAVDALRKGAIDYVLKPFEEEELKIRIKRALEKQRLGTELKQAENAMRESDEKYRSLFEQALDGIALADFETGIIVDCNNAMAQLVKRNKSDLIGKPQSILHPKENLDEHFTKGFKKIRSQKMGHADTVKIITSDGEIIFVDVSTNIFEFEGKKLIQGVFRDITERKKKEEELQASEERFSKAFNANPSMMSIMRMSDRKHIYVNNTFTHFTGYTREEALGKGMSDLNMWADMRDREETLKLYYEGKNPFQNTEIKYFTKTGELRRALVSSEIIEINGEACILSAATDVTELRRLEEQLQTRQRMDSLGVLAGGIAHDFNNILVGIMGYIEMLNFDGEGLSGTQKEYIKTALRNCQRAADFIRNFQTFSKGVVAEREIIDIYFPAKEVFILLKETTERLIEKYFTIEPEKFYVTASPIELNQIFLNLGTNAIHAVEERGIKTGDYIKMTAEDYWVHDNNKTGLPQGEYVHIMFEDNGIGMSEAVKQKAFDPLFTTRKKGTQKGQGLGLAMVYNIVTNMLKGHLTIESIEGKGTTFHIYLPKSQPAKFKEIKKQSEIKSGNESILVVDDEETILNLVEASLKHSGYAVSTAADGEQALEAFKAHKDTIALVILDLTMPKMPGKMVFEQMLTLKPDVKVIISSGQSEEEIREGVLATAKGFAQKPYKLRELAKMIRKALDE